jgi:hypothetical protein
MTKLSSPDRVQVPSPDRRNEPAFRDVIARMSGNLLARDSRKGGGEPLQSDRLRFFSLSKRLLEAANSSLIDLPFLDRNNVVPRGHARGNAGCKPC